MEKDWRFFYNKFIKQGVCSFFLLFSFSVVCAQNEIAGWHKIYNDSVIGTDVSGALRILKENNKQPQGKIIVGIIDSGAEISSQNIAPALWTNQGETAGDRKDNDGNGYSDDIHGWNFLGSADGSFNMLSAGTEEFRQFKALYPKYKNIESCEEAEDKSEFDFYQRMRRKAGINSYLMFYQYAQQKKTARQYIDAVLSANGIGDTLTIGGFSHLNINDSTMEECLQMHLTDFYKSGFKTKWKDFEKQQDDALALMKTRIEGIENDKDKRLLVGDDLNDFEDIHYGNNTLNVEGFEHGTFVAGVVAGTGEGDERRSGVASGCAELMILRASPDGDEYDKDIATAIRYAVDNGAKVINISLGKTYSPDSLKVSEAIAYAADKDVLIVQAAGNSHADIDSIAYFPTGRDANGREFGNFIRVGASNRLGDVSAISNYGKKNVTLYAPGEEIVSSFGDGKFELQRGTSVAAPVVSGIAAMLRSYFPYLKAAEIKDILLETARERRTVRGEIKIVDAKAAVERILALNGVDWKRVDACKAASQKCYNYNMSTSFLDGSNFLIVEDSNKDCYIVNVLNQKKEPLLKSGNSFVKQYETLSGDTTSFANGKFRPFSLSYSLKIKNNDARYLYYERKGKHFVYDRKTDRLTVDEKFVEKKDKERGSRFGAGSHSTKDSLFTMLGDRYNLYVRNNKTGEIKKLTSDGKEYATYCSRNAKDTIAEGQANGSWKGHVYINYIYDDSEVGDLYIISALKQPRPELTSKKMPIPNEKGVRRMRIFWYDADKDEARMLPIDRFKDQSVKLGFGKDEKTIWFTRQSRSVDSLDLCRIDIPTGEVTTVISEVCKPHFNVNLFGYRLINDEKEIVWWSERTGKGNYYLYDCNGKLKNRITQGDNIVAGRIESIDTISRTMIFAGYGNEEGIDPYYTFYYKVALNGKNQQPLTFGNGNHSLEISRDKRFAIDKYSRMDMPMVYNFVSLENPKKHFEIGRVPVDSVRKAGWIQPKLLKLKAADKQTDLYGVMFLPSNLDPEKKYPIITNVYPGPQDDQIERNFTVDDNGNQSLAEMGFVVINVAPRGSSPLRGKDFLCYGYGNLRDYPIDDDKYAIEQLARDYSFIDTTRVGIYGHSGGGFETVTAMLTYPDFYKVGVAASGNYDNNIYIQWWGETWHGLKPIPTAMELAGNLKGRLMLVCGDEDENVPFASTIRMANALQKAGKRFDMMIMPGQGHGLYGDYYNNIIRYYFKEHLMNPSKFDIDIINHK